MKISDAEIRRRGAAQRELEVTAAEIARALPGIALAPDGIRLLQSRQ